MAPLGVHFCTTIVRLACNRFCSANFFGVSLRVAQMDFGATPVGEALQHETSANGVDMRPRKWYVVYVPNAPTGAMALTFDQQCCMLCMCGGWHLIIRATRPHVALRDGHKSRSLRRRRAIGDVALSTTFLIRP